MITGDLLCYSCRGCLCFIIASAISLIQLFHEALSDRQLLTMYILEWVIVALMVFVMAITVIWWGRVIRKFPSPDRIVLPITPEYFIYGKFSKAYRQSNVSYLRVIFGFGYILQDLTILQSFAAPIMPSQTVWLKLMNLGLAAFIDYSILKKPRSTSTF